MKRTFFRSLLYWTCLGALAFGAARFAHAQGSAPIGLNGNLGLTTWSAGTGTSYTANAQQMIGILSGAPTGAATYTTDTATNLCALFPQVANTATQNYQWDWWVRNTSTFLVTLANGTGVTIASSSQATVAPNTQRHYKVVLNNCGATPAATVQGMDLAPSAWEGYGSAATTGPVATGTISVATYGNGVFSGIMNSTPTAAETLTTDTATNLCAATPVNGLANTNGYFTEWYIRNLAGGAYTISVSAGAGVTVVGTGNSVQNNYRHFRVVFTNCGSGTQAVSYYSLDSTSY